MSPAVGRLSCCKSIDLAGLRQKAAGASLHHLYTDHIYNFRVLFQFGSQLPRIHFLSLVFAPTKNRFTTTRYISIACKLFWRPAATYTSSINRGRALLGDFQSKFRGYDVIQDFLARMFSVWDGVTSRLASLFTRLSGG